MAELSNWLKGIILLLLFAIFLDLLLPSERFARVFKMATGLVILLAMLAPVLSILHGKISFNDILQAGGIPQSASMDAIAQNAAQISQRTQGMSELEWKKQLQSYITQEVQSLYPVTVSSVEVNLLLPNANSGGDSQQQPKLQSIRLYVATRAVQNSSVSPSYKQASTNSVTPVQPISPVAKVQIGQSSGNSPAGASAVSEGSETAEQIKIGRDIGSKLSTDFQISPSAIEVHWG
ncbi:MAG: hypothetical protein JWN30_227 [Bacilli bacterium]|nr:hypothetical protein [Bacilli bacterium]